MQNQEFIILKNKFIEHDPIGLIESGAHSDECDGLIYDIIRLKSNTVNMDDFVNQIVNLIEEDFGISMTIERTAKLKNILM